MTNPGPPVDWVDLHAPGAGELEDLRRRFGIDPADLPPAGRAPRPGIMEGAGYVVVTLVGAVEADAADGMGEVRCVVGPDWLVTIHDDPCAALGAVPRAAAGPAGALEAVARTLVTSLVGLVREVDAQVSAVEEGEVPLSRGPRRTLSALRRVVLPQRDVLIRLGQGEGIGDEEAPEAAARGFRNAAERMAQIGAEAETLREALHDASTDRQNDIVKRLTVVAVIFLPLTFLTGFFGQNFHWLTDHVGGGWWFVGLGLVLPVVAVGGLLLTLRRRGWL